MPQNVLENSLSEQGQTLLGLLKIINKVKDENEFINLVYIAQTLGYVGTSYEFRIDELYHPFSSDLYCDIRLLEIEGYITKGSITLTEKGKKEAREDLIKKQINKIVRLYKSQDIETAAQVVYLYKEKIPQKEILANLTLYSQKPSRIQRILRLLNNLAKD